MQDAQAADASISFSFLSLCGGRAMTWTLTPRSRARTRCSMMRILIALVLQPQSVLRSSMNWPDALASVADAPDRCESLAGVKSLRSQSASKHSGDLVDLVLVRGDQA